MPTGDRLAVKRTAQFFLNSFQERLDVQKKERDEKVRAEGFWVSGLRFPGPLFGPGGARRVHLRCVRAPRARLQGAICVRTGAAPLGPEPHTRAA